MTKAVTIFLTLATCVALLALPAAAGAEYFIPDGNSAVNQYTEGVPSGGGEKSTKGAGEEPVRPGRAIGTENTRKLEQAGGQEGREAAEVAAETAPAEVVVVTEEPSGGKQTGNGQGQGGNKGEDRAQRDDDGSGESEDNVVLTPVSGGGEGPSGSGGLGEIVSAATGGSSGGIGLLLPLVIVAAVVCGVGYAWRRRDSDPTPAPSR